MAYISQDKYLIDIFKSGKDVHNQTARDIFGENFTKEQRVKAKGINFGIAYGLTAQGLANDVNIPIHEAQYYINKWFENAKEAHKYLLQCDKDLEEGKVFTTLFGRKRRYGLINMHDEKQLKHLKNEARNFAIQSIASDLTLLSAMAMENELLKYNATIVNLVHDSIIVEVANSKSVVTPVIDIITNTMQQIPKDRLRPDFPFPAEIAVGKSWGAMKGLKL